MCSHVRLRLLLNGCNVEFRASFILEFCQCLLELGWATNISQVKQTN